MLFSVMELEESDVPPLSEGEVDSDIEDGDTSEEGGGDDEDGDTSEEEGGEGEGQDDEDEDISFPRPAPGKRKSRKVCSRDEMADRLRLAVEEFRQDMFMSIRQCAKHHRVSHSTLSVMLNDPEAEYKGRGKQSQVFFKEEEDAIARHITERMVLGCGLDLMQVKIYFSLTSLK